MAASDSNVPLKIGVLIPAFQAEATIAAVVRACRFFLDDVLVIDDGSRDRTAALAEAAGARVLRHTENRGKGEALKTGFAEAKRLSWSGAITLDADAQHAAKDLPKFARLHAMRPEALLLGRRAFSQMPLGSQLMRALGLVFLSFSAWRFMSDTQCGFRLYPVNWINQVHALSPRFEFESEILVIAGRSKTPVLPVPVETIYFTGERLQKHVRPADAWKIVFLFYDSLKPGWMRERRG